MPRMLVRLTACAGTLHIRASGKVSGKLEYSQIQIERGGEFRGEMQQVGAAPVYPSATPAMAAAKPPAPMPGKEAS